MTSVVSATAFRDGWMARNREARRLLRRGLSCLFATVLFLGDASAAGRIRFWNLTTGTIKEFRLAPAGTTEFGKNQCENDKDGTVDHDERLPILGVGPGRYDAKIVYTTGKACMARDIEVKDGKVFALEDRDLRDCK
ncbi:MAG: hypothetical protein ACHQAY_14300 [Hyphomicrobiales bacterium]